MTASIRIEPAQASASDAPVATAPPNVDDELQPYPDHTQLPAEDGTFAKNFLEHPQSILLTESIWPVLQQKHPDSQFTIGQDSGIYWRLTDPPQRGAVSPDWYYVPDVPPVLDGKTRRSYVFWRELIAPLILIEFVSDEEGGEYDKTPYEGKFWIYENIIRPAYYAIYHAEEVRLDVYHLIEDQLQPLKPNQRRHFPIWQLHVELGMWPGVYKNVNLAWLRWWDDQGKLLLTGDELAIVAGERAEREAQRAEQAEKRSARLAARLRALGIDPDEDEAA